MAEQPQFDRLCEAVTDRTPIDWPSHSGEPGEQTSRSALHGLRVIDGISRFHLENDTFEVDAETLTVETQPGEAAKPSAPRVWNGFELRALVGAGGFGSVYRGWDPVLEREIAVKLVPLTRLASEDRRFREGRFQARVRHPNIVAVHGGAVADGFAGIWMDYVAGRTLEDELRRRGKYGIQEVAAIGVETCRALASIHQAGLVHRDVKTSNLMREEGGRILLMDLGAGYDPGAEYGEAKVISGTPLFMAPEVLRGEEATHSADIYGLGVVLFRLLSASYPIAPANWQELVSRHEQGAREKLRDLRPELDPGAVRIIERALAADPAARYSSAGEMQEALESLLVAQGSSRQRSVTPTLTRRRFLIGTVLVTAAIALASWGSRVLIGGGTFEVHAELLLRQSGDRGSIVLGDGDPIAVGDHLIVELESSEDVHVYVLNRDDQGALFLLFPMRETETTNPIERGVRHRLPGMIAGVPQAWKITTGGRIEQFLIVASREPLAELEQDLAGLARPSADTAPYARLSDESERRLRGAGAVVADPESEMSVDVFDRVKRLEDSEGSVNGIWMRSVRLVHY